MVVFTSGKKYNILGNRTKFTDRYREFRLPSVNLNAIGVRIRADFELNRTDAIGFKKIDLRGMKLISPPSQRESVEKAGNVI